MKWAAASVVFVGAGLAVVGLLMARGDGSNRSPETEVALGPDEPARKIYLRGEVFDIDKGTLFLDPKTGGGEAWAGVRSSPSGMLVAWNGTDRKQPPVLFETDTYRKVTLDTGGAFGAVLDYSPDDSEVSVRVGQEVLIVSTRSGDLRLRFPLDADAAAARAYWGPDGRVAVQSSRQDRTSLGLLAWVDGSIKSFRDVPDNWAQW